ncbi:MAG: HAMP domain-containing histidine kinase [Anaerolineaceae bacterium]|nr:HAMP domain-containing histidine kinase [Anaerolineaceae bacterium]
MTTVSHEFRTPLATIMSSTELLERYLDRLSPARRDECLAVVRVQVQHMKEILDDLSLLIAIDVDSISFEPEFVSLRKILHTVTDRMDLQFFDWQPSFSEGLDMINADEGLLIPILRHLIANALRYSPQGSTIRFNARIEGEILVMEISDQGLGILQEDIDHIFDTFYRGKNVAHIGGTGLGLAIVKRCAKLSGGDITCQSHNGTGTTFTVRLPSV